MASFRAHNPNRPWMARRRRAYVEYVIGFFDNKEDAVEAERGFDEIWPPNYGSNKGTRRHVSAGGRYYFA